MEEITIIIGSFCFSVIVAIVAIYSCRSDNKSEYTSTNVTTRLNNTTEEEEFIFKYYTC